MAYVRGQAAFVEETIRAYITGGLQSFGWMNTDGTAPYGATAPVVVIDYLPGATEVVADNTIAMTSGNEGEDTDDELGASSGGLFTVERVFFLDIFGENQGIALRIADDVKAIVTGKLPGFSRYQNVIDGAGGHLDGHLLHFEAVQRNKPLNVDYKRNWQVVKFMAVHEFSAVEYPVAAP